MCITHIRNVKDYIAIVTKDGAGSCVIFHEGCYVVIFRVDMTGIDNPVILMEVYYPDGARSAYAQYLADLITHDTRSVYFQIEKEPEPTGNRFVSARMREEVISITKRNTALLVSAGLL